MDLKEVLESGDLDVALQQTAQRVKKNPNDAPARYLLAELHCINGDWQRADSHLDVIYRQQEKLTPQVTVFRQLLRAAEARQECFQHGRLPVLQQEPDQRIQLHLRAIIALRDDNKAEAKQLLDEAEASRPHLQGDADGTSFDDLRDLDDLTSSFLEVLTAEGEYYWFPFEHLTHVEFQEPNRLRDLLWRPARAIGRQGPIGNVYLPCLYPGTEHHEDAKMRLGRLTDWLDEPEAPVRGVGLRMWLVGEQEKSLLALGRVTVSM